MQFRSLLVKKVYNTESLLSLDFMKGKGKQKILFKLF